MLQVLGILCTSDEGQDIAEYAAMLAVILVLVIGTIRFDRRNANTAFFQRCRQFAVKSWLACGSTVTYYSFVQGQREYDCLLHPPFMD